MQQARAVSTERVAFAWCCTRTPAARSCKYSQRCTRIRQKPLRPRVFPPAAVVLFAAAAAATVGPSQQLHLVPQPVLLDKLLHSVWWTELPLPDEGPLSTAGAGCSGRYKWLLPVC